VKPLVVSAYNYTVYQQAAEDFFSPAPDGSCVPKSLFAENLVEGPDDIKDFFVLDVRGPDDFAAGHIEGATNIVITDVFKTENLARLPKNKPILVVCNSGTSGAMSTAALDLMGYDGWQLRYGIGSWQDKTPTAVWSMDQKNMQNIQGGNYPVVKS
jgi:rhodanese-related sulfurtransferase